MPDCYLRAGMVNVKKNYVITHMKIWESNDPNDASDSLKPASGNQDPLFRIQLILQKKLKISKIFIIFN
jgi:hypothetical protein